MKDTLAYKDFVGSVHFSSEDSVFLGRIEGINDLVTFEGESVAELKSSFKDAVEDYIHLCKENNRPIYKSYRGSFNVRVSPELHRKAVQTSQKLGVSLNQLVQAAIEKELEKVKL